MLKKVVFIFVTTCALVLADIAPWEDFEGMYRVNRINLATGEIREMDLDFGRCGGRDHIYTGWMSYNNTYPSDGFSILKSGWIAAVDTADGGQVGIFKKQGPDCISGISLRLADSTLYTWTSEGTELLQLEPAWARGIFGGFGISHEDSTEYRFRLTLDGIDKIWSAQLSFKNDDYQKITKGYGLSVGNAVALLFPLTDTFFLKLYTAEEYVLESRWIKVYYDQEGREKQITGSDWLDFRSYPD